jgi:hypothetical protein
LVLVSSVKGSAAQAAMSSLTSLSSSVLGAKAGPGLVEGRHGTAADVVAPDEPCVVGLDGEHRDEADDRGVVGEDADDVGATGDLAVEALQITSPCSSRSTGLTTSSIVILSRPAIAGLLSSKP